jgi:phosphoglycolate phosphatase
VSTELLVLFDLDGTLLIDDTYTHGRAMVRAMREVYRVSLPDNVVELIDPAGKTDLRIARDALRRAGVSDDLIDQYLCTWMTAATDAFLDQAATDAGGWMVRPHLADGLRRLESHGMRLGLVTGNLQRIAQAKLEHMGVALHFNISASAYGSDAEERIALVRIARQRAGSPGRPWERGRTIVVGDTPRDIAAAQADSVACLVFSSARFAHDRLIGALAVVSDMDELVHALQACQQTGINPGPS